MKDLGVRGLSDTFLNKVWFVRNKMGHKNFVVLLACLALVLSGQTSAEAGLSSQEADSLIGRAANGDTEALRTIESKAALGDPRAQNKLGFLYARGNGVKKDKGKALALHRMAAEKGLAEAQAALGAWYENTTPPDYKQAIKWFLKAGEQGDVGSQAELCLQYHLGENIPKNYSKALVWCSKAAHLNDSSAQLTLGLMYAAGQGVQRNQVQALKWGLIAKANQGGPMADGFVSLVEANLSPEQVSVAQEQAQSWWASRK